MSSKKAQSKAGIPEQRRGQQMGESKDSNEKAQTKSAAPALRGRRKEANEMFADRSSQQVGSNTDAPRDNTPSVPAAIPTGTKLGESGGEKVFKARKNKRQD